MKKTILLVIFLFASACNVPVHSPLESIKDNLPVGSILQLTRTIIIPADRSYMYIANGEVKKLKNYNTVNIYQPYCTIHLYKESTLTRKIEPDFFEVTNILEYERNYGRLFDYKNNMTEYHNGRFIKISKHDGGGPSIVMYATILSLRSTKQPEVKELVCGHWNDPAEIEPLTLKEMKSALGDLMVIKKNVW